MPICYCFTSLKESKVPKGFECRLAALVAEILSKPIERISVIVNPDQRICKAGICDPAAILQIRSIAVFDAERNPKYFQPIFDFLTKELELPENRLTIEFVDIEGHMAMNGK